MRPPGRGYRWIDELERQEVERQRGARGSPVSHDYARFVGRWQLRTGRGRRDQRSYGLLDDRPYEHGTVLADTDAVRAHTKRPRRLQPDGRPRRHVHRGSELAAGQ